MVQAQAAGVEPSVEMNPILLKPTSDRKSQVIAMGRPLGNMSAVEYHNYKPNLRKLVKDTYDSLESKYDAVVIEGAGSPAEINLKEGDLVNMWMAEAADAPVLLVGDIDRGGVFASLYGTIMLLEPEERARIKGMIINKFRGDVRILEPGLRMIEEKVGIPVVGVVPWTDVDVEDEDMYVDPSEYDQLEAEFQAQQADPGLADALAAEAAGEHADHDRQGDHDQTRGQHPGIGVPNDLPGALLDDRTVEIHEEMTFLSTRKKMQWNSINIASAAGDVKKKGAISSEKVLTSAGRDAIIIKRSRDARVVELADSLDSGSSVHSGRAGSSPASRTTKVPKIA